MKKRTLRQTIELFRRYSEDFAEKARLASSAEQTAYYMVADAYDNVAFELEQNLVLTEEEKALLDVKLVSKTFDIPMEEIDPGDPRIAFYKRVIFEADALGVEVEWYDADDYAWLNTLFGYDIGFEVAHVLSTYGCDDMGCACIQDIGDLERLKNYFETFNDRYGLTYFTLDFSHFAEEMPKYIQYSDWGDWERKENNNESTRTKARL